MAEEGAGIPAVTLAATWVRPRLALPQEMAPLGAALPQRPAELPFPEAKNTPDRNVASLERTLWIKLLNPEWALVGGSTELATCEGVYLESLGGRGG